MFYILILTCSPIYDGYSPHDPANLLTYAMIRKSMLWSWKFIKLLEKSSKINQVFYCHFNHIQVNQYIVKQNNIP